MNNLLYIFFVKKLLFTTANSKIESKEDEL